MVLPRAVDLEVPQGDAFLPQVELLGHPPARLVAGDDRHLQPVQSQVLEGEPEHDSGRLGRIPVPGHRLVDPVADIGVLERAPLDAGDVDLAAEAAVDEDAESVAAPQLAFAVAGAAPGREHPAVLGRVRLAGEWLRLPLHQPVTAAAADLLPGLEVGHRERPE